MLLKTIRLPLDLRALHSVLPSPKYDSEAGNRSAVYPSMQRDRDGGRSAYDHYRKSHLDRYNEKSVADISLNDLNDLLYSNKRQRKVSRHRRPRQRLAAPQDQLPSIYQVQPHPRQKNPIRPRGGANDVGAYKKMMHNNQIRNGREDYFTRLESRRKHQNGNSMNPRRRLIKQS
jgi:hypothetical protein